MIGEVENNSIIFILNRSDLDGRIDVNYYNQRVDTIGKIKLSKFAKIKGGKRIPLGFDYSNTETNFLYLRVANMDEGNDFNYSDFKFISEELFNFLSRYEVFENELIISIAGTIGKIKLVTNIPENRKVILTENCAKIVFDINKISPKYFQIVLQSAFVQKQIELSYIQTTIPKLGIDKILNLYLPSLPSIEKQRIVVAKYETAYAQKQQKEAQAKALLQSIDTYILETLGITIPEKQNGIEHRIFTANFSDVVGSRIDPKLYDRTTKDLKAAIANTSFTKVELKKLLIQSIAGDWGKDENEADLINLEEYTKCLVIRATEFENEGNLTLDNSRVKYRLILNSKLKKIDIQENDLLIEKSGGSIDQPVGRIALITKEHISNNVLCYSNFIHKIRVDKNHVNPFYLFYFLKAIHNLKLTDAMQSQTNGIRNLIMSNYFDQIIPIPSKNIQNEIVKHIDDLHHQINTLKADAIAVLENAKSEVEKMILG